MTTAERGGRRVEHERLHGHAVAPELDARARRPAEAVLHGLAARHRERASPPGPPWRPPRTRRRRPGRSPPRSARGRRARSPPGTPGRLARRCACGGPCGGSCGAHALHERARLLGPARLDAHGLPEPCALGAPARPRDGRRGRGQAREAHDAEVGARRCRAVHGPLRRGGRQPALEARIGIVQQVGPCVLVEARPAVEAPAIAREPRRQVAGCGCRLHHHGAVAAGRVDAGGTRARPPVPAGKRQQAGGERALERRLGTVVGREVGAAVERGARQVERDGGALLAHAHVDGRVGMLGVHVRALPPRLAQAVAHGVLHLERGEARVAQLVVHAVGRHRDARAGRDHVLPGKLQRVLEQQVGQARVHAPHHQHDARGQPGPQARRERVAHVAEEGDAAAERPHAPDAEGLQLVGERGLQPGEAAGEELEFFLLHSAIPLNLDVPAADSREARTGARRSVCPTAQVGVVSQREGPWCPELTGWGRRSVLQYASLRHRGKAGCQGPSQHRLRSGGRQADGTLVFQIIFQLARAAGVAQLRAAPWPRSGGCARA